MKYIRSQKDPRGKIGRWILELENIDLSIKYLKGENNIEADYMSRIHGSDQAIENPSVYYNVQTNKNDIAIIKKAQKEDIIVKEAKLKH